MVRFSVRSSETRTPIVGGFAAGVAHAAVALLLWNRWFDDVGGMLATKPLNGAYVLLGMFLLGFVPVLLYLRERVVSPAVIVAVCLLLSGLVSWLMGSVRAPAAVPTPFALYILSWVGIVPIAGVAGGLEHRRKRRPTG